MVEDLNFSTLNKSKDKIRLKAWNLLKTMAGSEDDTEILILDMIRVYLPELYEVYTTSTTIAENIESVFKVYQSEIKETKVDRIGNSRRSNQRNTMKKATQLTGYSKSSLYYALKSYSWWMKRIEKNEIRRAKFDR